MTSTSSELSELTSAIDSDDANENQIPAIKQSHKGKLDHYFTNGTVKPLPILKKKRPPSPPHEYVLADNADIAFICMFRSRFSDAFPKSMPHLGPQDIETGVVESRPSEAVERFLCALLSLVLNRKKDVEKGHYGRALEEAVHTYSSQWPTVWQSLNPLHAGGSFDSMSPEQRLTLLRALIIWSLEASDAVKAIIKESYKQVRHEDDLNQPLSVQSWGKDGDRRRYWLIEGQDDTHFRLYRESNPASRDSKWRSVAGTIQELHGVAETLVEDNTQASRRLHDRIVAAIPRFEAGEDKRRRRDYRNARKAAFTRPEQDVSMYEGRTRGKKMRYTYSDEDEFLDSDEGRRGRSRRQQAPAEPAGPVYTASGRQVKSRYGGTYGESASGPGQEVNADFGNGSTGRDAVGADDMNRTNMQNGSSTAKKDKGDHARVDVSQDRAKSGFDSESDQNSDESNDAGDDGEDDEDGQYNNEEDQDGDDDDETDMSEEDDEHGEAEELEGVIHGTKVSVEVPALHSNYGNTGLQSTKEEPSEAMMIDGNGPNEAQKSHIRQFGLGTTSESKVS